MFELSAANAFLAFEKLTPAERLDYLKDQPITTENQAFMDGSKRVGDPAAVVVKYRAMIRGVRLGGWHDSPAAAIAAGREFVEEFDGEL